MSALQNIAIRGEPAGLLFFGVCSCQRWQTQKGAAMSDILEFSGREEFRKWLSEHCLSTDGVWLLFGKAGGPKTIKAPEALEEALCFGWIDGQMKSIDDKTYIKYFSMRREKSKWSEKIRRLPARFGCTGRPLRSMPAPVLTRWEKSRG